LSKYYSEAVVYKSCKFYIQTKSQNYPPNRQEGLTHDDDNVVRENFLPIFITKILNNENNKDRFYLVLADFGMGKTTSMINLYKNYMYIKKHKICLFTFKNARILEFIKKIDEKEAKQTILLLDAFDEYEDLYQADYITYEYLKGRLSKIAYATRNFHKVDCKQYWTFSR